MGKTIADRIVELISELKMSKNQFAKTIGTSSALISQITTKKDTFRVDLVQKIICAFPGLNANWLLTEFGSMWLENQENMQGLQGSEAKMPSNDGKMEAIQGELKGKTQPGQYAQVKSEELDEMIKNKLLYMEFYLVGILYHLRFFKNQKSEQPSKSESVKAEESYIKKFRGDIFSGIEPPYLKLSANEKVRLLKELDEATRDYLDKIWLMTREL